MKLSELFEELQTGVLLTTSVIDECEGELKPSKYAQIIGYINLGLTDLHIRFPLDEREVVVQEYDHITIYKLSSEYAQSNTGSTQPIKYIADSVENPFQDNIISISGVYDEEGIEIPVNDYNLQNSLYTPSYNTIQIPNPDSDNAIFIIYRANHVKIPRNTTDPTTVDINIPDVMLNALTYYIGYKFHANLQSADSQTIAQNYQIQYESACLFLEANSTVNSDSRVTNIKSIINGWV